MLREELLRDQLAVNILNALQPVLDGYAYTYNSGGTIESGIHIDPIGSRRVKAKKTVMDVLRAWEIDPDA